MAGNAKKVMESDSSEASPARKQRGSRVTGKKVMDGLKFNPS
jgi:hypothetical protein